VLHAGLQNDDIASGIFFRTFLGAALTTSFKNHNHFLSLVKMPRKSDPWAENVFMMSDCVPSSLFAMKLRTLAFGPLGTLPSFPRKIGMRSRSYSTLLFILIRANVRYRHLADILIALNNVRF
jgi:hypothetical protein